MRELIKEIWSTSRRNKLRTSLTGFAVAWGIFMLIFLLGAGNGLVNAQLEQREQFIANSIMVYPGETTKAYNGLKEGRSITLNDKDKLITEHTFAANTENVSSKLEQNSTTLVYGTNYMTAQTLSGVYPSLPKIDKTEILYGRFINDIDMKEQRKVAVLSHKHAKELYGADYKTLVGKNIKIDNFMFHVVGIYKGDDSQSSDDVYTAFTTLKAIYGKGDEAGDIMFNIEGLPGKEENTAFENNYRAALNNNHQAAPDDNGSIWIWNRYVQNIQMSEATSFIQTALWIVGLFTLLSGIVGVSNIMLITVKERTREFGIRKAIGATPWSILKLIIAESILMTGFFGYVGMVCGVIANEIMDVTIGQMQMDLVFAKISVFKNPTVGLDVCIEATLAIIIAGTVAGLLPAIKAARIRPIEALRAD